MLVSGIFGRQNIQDLEALLEFPNEVFAEIDAPVLVRLANHRKYMPAFLITIRMQGHEIFFPFIQARTSVSRHINVKFETRGSHTLGGYTISSTFPFNFFTRFRAARSAIGLVVYPRPVKCELDGAYDRLSRARGERSSDLVGSDADLISIRDYVPGDQPKHISWKSTAKTGVLKTRELSAIELQLVIIDFDRMDKRDLEHTISGITHLVLHLLRLRTPVGMRIGGETYRPGDTAAHRRLLLTRLALYGQNQNAP